MAAALALMAHVAAADQVKGKISKINLTDNTFEVGGQPFAASPTNTVGAKLSELKNGDTVQVSYAHTNLTGNQSINAMSLTKLASAEIVIGLITKTDNNPFFVKMKEGAEAKAKELGVELQTFAGKYDGDNDSQVAAIESLIAAGAKGILITPSDTKAIVPTDQEGARRRHPGDRARHAARSDRRGRRHLRHRQLQGRRADRRSGPKARSATRRRTPRSPSSTCAREPADRRRRSATRAS